MRFIRTRLYTDMTPHTPDGPDIRPSSAAPVHGAVTFADQDIGATATAGARWSNPASGVDYPYEELSTAEAYRMGRPPSSDETRMLAPSAAPASLAAARDNSAVVHASTGKGAQVQSALMAAAPLAISRKDAELGR